MPRRILDHPVLGELPDSELVAIHVDGLPLGARRGEPIAAALLAAGKRVLRRSRQRNEPRGVFCAIGRCTDCAMTVDGRPNVRTCVTPVREGMRIETQRGLGTFGPGVAAAASTGEAARAPEDAEVVVVGAGPAGLRAAIEAARAGAWVTLLDEKDRPGGQLVKQIHRFFGTSAHHAGERGFEIGEQLLAEVQALGVEVRLSTVVWGAFEGPVLGCATADGQGHHLRAERLILATGASELAAAFPGWTRPGVMGAGAAQTLMNLHRVLPGRRALMVGAGNVGLIVAYQLLQAGAQVAAIVEAAPRIGGWDVHAARVRRAGVPILTQHTVLEALGCESVTGALVGRLDETGAVVAGSERRLRADLICLAVGLRPQTQLAGMLNLAMADDPRRGGCVPQRDERMRSSDEHVYVAGDLGEVSEASIAMEEGRIAGRAAAASLGYGEEAETARLVREARARIEVLDANVGPGPARRRGRGSTGEDAGATPIVECYQRIPCDPCEAACPTGAIRVGADPTALPRVDATKCTGCLRCVRQCPGMAIFVVKAGPEPGEATVALPWELLPLPRPGAWGFGLDRAGRRVCEARVVRVSSGRKRGDTGVVEVAVEARFGQRVRGFATGCG
ncbi:MAG: FAD-dependent oxidoreductase [Armatimonadetes bacterium]|nr:FAD-dependent oxidoreductase [Armatimonadota bacterium]